MFCELCAPPYRPQPQSSKRLTAADHPIQSSLITSTLQTSSVLNAHRPTMTISNPFARPVGASRRVAGLLLLLASTLVPTCPTFAAPTSKLVDGRYLVQRDGATVKDTRTGLTWMRCNVGQTWDGADCKGAPEGLTLSDAMTRAADTNKGKGYAGHTKWRLPTRTELGGLLICLHDAEMVQQNCPPQPANKGAQPIAFPGDPDRAYWTSTRASDGSPASILFAPVPMYGFSDPGEELYLRLVSR
jgi:hypothetical protein